GVDGLKPGEHVIINPIIACGQCDQCARGAGNLCRNAGLFGREIEGSLSQFVKLPARYVHVLPPRLPLEAATIIETLATVRHRHHRVGVATAESVVVLGMGTAGLLHARLAVLTGATPVIAVSRTQWKLDMAERMGAHHVVKAPVEKAVEEVKRLTGGKGADVVIDASGSAESLRAAGGMLPPGGRFSAFAVSPGARRRVSPFPPYFGRNEI